MRRLTLWLTLLGVFGAGSTLPAQAGIPVIDVSNLAQAILQVTNTITMITNQVSQIQNQVTQIQAITGSRGLGTVLNNPNLQNYIPTDAMASYGAVDGGYGALSATGKTLRDAQMIYNCVDKPAGSARTICQATFARPYQQKAYMQQGFNTSNQRMTQIQGLMSQINSTQDEKAIAEVQGRIGAETAMVLNEMSRAQYEQGMFQADQHAESNRQEELRMNQLNRTGNLVSQLPKL